MAELRTKIAEELVKVTNRWVAPNFPPEHKLREFAELDDREQRLNLDYADAAIAAMPGWRPIRTAPKMETVLVAGGDAIYPVTACWDGDPMDGWWVDGQEDTHCEIGWPTHWMPLPTPPAPIPHDGEKP